MTKKLNKRRKENKTTHNENLNRFLLINSIYYIIIKHDCDEDAAVVNARVCEFFAQINRNVRKLIVAIIVVANLLH